MLSVTSSSKDLKLLTENETSMSAPHPAQNNPRTNKRVFISLNSEIQNNNHQKLDFCVIYSHTNALLRTATDCTTRSHFIPGQAGLI